MGEMFVLIVSMSLSLDAGNGIFFCSGGERVWEPLHETPANPWWTESNAPTIRSPSVSALAHNQKTLIDFHQQVPWQLRQERGKDKDRKKAGRKKMKRRK